MMTVSEAAGAMRGRLVGGDARLSGVSTDSRTLHAGELFIAIKGERFDATAFAGQALERGAAAAVVPIGAEGEVVGRGPLIVVDDTRAALGRLAAAWRKRFTLPLVGLTGSNGKTTVKEMIAAVLRHACASTEAVLATEGNLNNDVGVPLTLLRLRERHRYAVVEMGMNHAGEIAYLTRLARPDVALVTNAGHAHVGLLGSLEAVARAKGEIYQGLGTAGVAIINADDAFAPLWRSFNAGRRVLEFALERPAPITGRYTGHDLHSDIVLTLPRGESRFTLNAPGAHNVRNALAAAAVAAALDIAPAAVGAGLASFAGVPGRMQRCRGAGGCVLIDDSYNANPDSTLAAVAVLARLAGKRVLVLGDMGELGAQAPALHAEVGRAARAAGIERLFTFGELARHASVAFGTGACHSSRIEDLLAAIERELDQNTTLLVKGSRFMQMERVVQAFRVQERA